MLGGASCLKEDDTRYFSDIYWFRSTAQSVKVDTSRTVALTDTIHVYRTAGLNFAAADSIRVAVVPAKTTAPDSVYALDTPIIRFANSDTTHAVLYVTIHPQRLTRQDTVALRLDYTFLNNAPQKRRHDLLRVVLIPVAPPATSTDTDTDTDKTTETTGKTATTESLHY